MRKSTQKCIITGVILITFIIVSLLILKIFFNYMLNPFQSEEEKKLKPFYKKITEGTDNLDLRSIRIDDDELWLIMYISGGRDTRFTDEDITSFAKVVEQTLFYLNNIKYEEIPASNVRLDLNYNVGQSPYGITCILLKQNGKFYFDSLRDDDHCLDITQFYLFRDVKHIYYEYFPQEIGEGIDSGQLPYLESLDIYISKEEYRSELAILTSGDFKDKIKITLK